MSLHFGFETPPIDLSGYGAGAVIEWSESFPTGLNDPETSPGDDGNWQQGNDGELLYLPYTSGQSIEPHISLPLTDLFPLRRLTLTLRYNPRWAPRLQRDFMWHLGGDDALANAKGNLLLSGLAAIITRWFWGYLDELPEGYTIIQTDQIDGEDWVGAWLEDPPSTDLTMALALVGVKPNEDGEYEHTFVHIDSVGAAAGADQTAPVTITDFTKAYLANKNHYQFFEVMPVNPALVDLLTDPSPGKFRSYYRAMVQESITWQFGETPERWFPFGTADVMRLEWSGLTLSGEHLNYSGDFALPGGARLPPGGLPPMG